MESSSIRYTRCTRCTRYTRYTRDTRYTRQASGVFFQDQPMVNYGGTVIGFATAFSMTRLLAEMLSRAANSAKVKGIFDLNDHAHACKHTGFLPIHVAVANWLAEMYDELITGPGGLRSTMLMRAVPGTSTQYGTMRSLALLAPGQLAVILGDKRMLQHVLKRQTNVVWRWGPVTQLRLSLNHIDSCGETGNDVMELIGGLDALREAQQMLLDDFMQGFLHDLFRQKWRLYGRPYYLAMRTVDLIYVGLLMALCIRVKGWGWGDDGGADGGVVEHARAGDVPKLLPVLNICYFGYVGYIGYIGPGDIPKLLPILNICAVVPIVCEDIRVCRLWYLNYVTKVRRAAHHPTGLRLLARPCPLASCYRLVTRVLRAC